MRITKKLTALLLMLCMVPFSAIGETYTGTAQGNNGEVTVEVTIKDAKIETVAVTAHKETAGICDAAIERIPQEIVDRQSVAVDTVSGATNTSKAILEGVKAAIAAAGLNAADYEKAAETAGDAQHQEMTCDVVVAGGGVSGLVAAISAADQGASVILVEKQAMLGGSTALSSAFMTTVNNSNFSEEYDDSIEKTMSVLMGTHDLSEDKTYPDVEALTKVMLATSDTVDFLLSKGMTAEFTAKSTATTAWTGKGPGLVQMLSDVAAAHNVTVLTECPAKEIIMQDGAAVGIQAESKGAQVTIHAKKVIIATGGAAWDQERLVKHMPTLANMTIANQSAAGNTGDGFAMMEAVGAQFYEGMRIMEGGVTYDEAWRKSIKVRPGTADKLSFNAEGERYTNEAPKTNQMLTYYMIKDGSSAYYWLYDVSNAELKASLDLGVEAGVVAYGETLEALAQKLGVDAAALRKTYDRYQQLCAAGEDQDFGKDASKLVAYVEDGGFYAVEMLPVAWGTLGGVVTDDNGCVMAESGNAIENLFAAGEMTNRKFFSDFYIGGNSLTTSATMGRLSAQEAMRQLKAE